jgi:hypothetical protein
MVRSSRRAALARAEGAFGLVALAACSADSPNVNAPPSSANLAAVGDLQDLGPARAAQVKHQGRLMQDRDILGTAIGRLNDGRPEITVLARNARAAAKMPRELDGVPVTVEVTGDITILPEVAVGPRARPGGGGGGSIKPTDRARPAYIGMSTGNANECASGTIGAKILKGGVIYALSNNHVFARENAAGNTAEKIYQPGRYDLGCASGSTYEWATLSSYQPISFSGNNTADAALAKLNSAGDLFGSTPPNGYGSPTSVAVGASVGLAVQKYGRTTGLTTGVVTGVNVTIRVQYTAGVATFVNQIQIRGDKGAFSKAGDSGSLIVTRPGRQPVGLLFAGGQTSTFANTIQDALTAVGGGSIQQ